MIFSNRRNVVQVSLFTLMVLIVYSICGLCIGFDVENTNDYDENQLDGALGLSGSLSLLQTTDYPYMRFSSYIGGSGLDTIAGVAIDSRGDIYLVGSTQSANFPVDDTLDDTYGNNTDAFLVKLDPKGEMIWSTFIGGSMNEVANAITTDDYGNIYVTGATNSSDFPRNVAYQPGLSGDFDAFLVSYHHSGIFRWGTYLGGTSDDYGYGLATDSDGNVYVVGDTFSDDFPVLVAQQDSKDLDKDAFVSSFRSNGSLRWSTYLGGSGNDTAKAVAVDNDDQIYVTGSTNSIDFPVSDGYKNGLLDPSVYDGFLARYMSDGERIWSADIGGSKNEMVEAIAIDENNHIYITGKTYSDDFFIQDAYQGNIASLDQDIFLTSFAGDDIAWSTYLGGIETDQAYGLAIYEENLYLTGSTTSDNFPVLNGYKSDFYDNENEHIEAVISSFTLEGDLRWSTYLGGNLMEEGSSITCNADGEIIVVGTTMSDNFPAEASDSEFNGDFDGFISQIYDPLYDPDGDGLNNYEEYISGRDLFSYDRTFLNFYIFVLIGLVLVGLVVLLWMYRKQAFPNLFAKVPEDIRAFGKKQAVFTEYILKMCNENNYNPLDPDITYDEVTNSIYLLLKFNQDNEKMPDRDELFEMGARLDAIPIAINLFNVSLEELDLSEQALKDIIKLSEKVTIKDKPATLQELVLLHSLNFFEAKILLNVWARLNTIENWPKDLLASVRDMVSKPDPLALKSLITAYEQNIDGISPIWVASSQNLSYFKAIYMVDYLEKQLAQDIDIDAYSKSEILSVEELSRTLMRKLNNNEIENYQNISEVILKMDLESIPQGLGLIKYYSTKIKGETFNIGEITSAGEQVQTGDMVISTLVEDDVQGEIDKLMEQFRKMEKDSIGKV